MKNWQQFFVIFLMTLMIFSCEKEKTDPPSITLNIALEEATFPEDAQLTVNVYPNTPTPPEVTDKFARSYSLTLSGSNATSMSMKLNDLKTDSYYFYGLLEDILNDTIKYEGWMGEGEAELVSIEDGETYAIVLTLIP